MLKKLNILTTAVLVALSIAFCANGATVKTAPAKKTIAPVPADNQAKDVLNKLIASIKSLESYKFTAFLEGMDTFTKDRQKDMVGDYKSLAKKTNTSVEVEEKAQMKRGLYEVKFMKPYLNQMKVVKSDFVPKLIYGTLITYRADKDPEVWWAKPKISPIAIKRSVEKDDSAGAITMNWYNVLLHLMYYSTNADLSLQPETVYEERPCYVLRVTFDWNKRPKWNHKKPDFAEFGIPGPIQEVLWKDMLEIERQKFTYIDYFIDKERLIPLKTEEYVEGKFHWRTMFRDIAIGGLTADDF